MSTYDLTIKFPSEEARLHFAHWMCDGGGEEQMFDSMEHHIPEQAVNRMSYHAEDESFPRDDRRRYGPFLADNTIWAQRIEREGGDD